MGILRSQVNIRDLEKLDDTVITGGNFSKTGSGKIKMSKSASVSTEINLLGKTVDEAIMELDKYLDDAYIASAARSMSRAIALVNSARVMPELRSWSSNKTVKINNALRIVPYFVLSQFYPTFAYREAYAPLLCSYRCRSLSHKNTPVQAHRGFRLLTLALLNII